MSQHRFLTRRMDRVSGQNPIVHVCPEAWPETLMESIAARHAHLHTLLGDEATALIATHLDQGESV